MRQQQLLNCGKSFPISVPIFATSFFKPILITSNENAEWLVGNDEEILATDEEIISSLTEEKTSDEEEDEEEAEEISH